MMSLFQESNTERGMWKLASIKASLCLLTLRKVTTNKNNYVGEGRGFQIWSQLISLTGISENTQSGQKDITQRTAAGIDERLDCFIPQVQAPFSEGVYPNL